MDERTDWWQRLGGPNAINLPAWIFTLVGGTLASFSWMPDGPLIRAAEWMVLSLAAQLALGGVLIMARVTYLQREPRPSRPAALIGTLLVAGFLRGALLAFAGEELSLTEHGFVLERATGAALAFTVWYALAMLVVDGWRSHHTIVGRLRSELSREQSLAEQSTVMITKFRHSVVERTESAISDGLVSASAVSGQPSAAATSLQRTVDDVIRPLSHELEQRAMADARLLSQVEEPNTTTHIPLFAYIGGIFTARPFAPLATTAVVIATPLVVSIHLFGAAIGILAVLLSAAVVGLSLRALRASTMAAFPRWSTGWCALVVIGEWLGITVIAGALFGAVVGVSNRQAALWMEYAGGSPTRAAVFSLVAMTLTTMVMAAVEGSVEYQMRTARWSLQQTVASVEWASARLRQRAWIEQRSLGRLLHGTVQASMVAAALKVREQSPQEAAETIAGLSTRLRYALGEGAETPWRRELENLSDVWDGAIDLTINVTPNAESALDQDPLAARCTFQVVSEAVTNAVRHGDANSVRATVETDPGYLLLTVHDDGTPRAGSPGSGTGTRIYDANCASWSLEFDSTTTLSARIACRSDESVRATGIFV